MGELAAGPGPRLPAPRLAVPLIKAVEFNFECPPEAAVEPIAGPAPLLTLLGACGRMICKLQLPDFGLPAVAPARP